MSTSELSQKQIVKQYKKWVTIAHNAAKEAKSMNLKPTASPAYVAADNVARQLHSKIKG